MDTLPKADTGATEGKPVDPKLAPSGPPNEPGNASPPVVVPKATPPDSRKLREFKFKPGTPEGDQERRNADAERKRVAREAAAKVSDPPALPSSAAAAADPSAPAMPGETPGLDAAPPPVIVPWTADDVTAFTDELVELSEAKRIGDFVTMAREHKMPPKFIAELERNSGYHPKTKAGLKRAIAACAAKWLNRTGVSSKNKEEVATLFFLVTIKLQGMRLRANLVQICEDQNKQRREAEAKAAKTAEVGV